MKKQVECPVCKQLKDTTEIFPGAGVRPALLDLIRKYDSNWTLEKGICFDCLNRARSDFVETSLIAERGTLTDAEKEVIEAIRSQELIAIHPSELSDKLTFGDRLADKVAEVGGSWRFIIVFFFILVIWIAINSHSLLAPSFDPYPYILLNLVLSCLAAIQAPVIMMSQNRKEEKDRRRAEADYKTNLKAELEIRHLHIKLDQLITHQWQKLLEIQQVQLDVMKDSAQRSKENPRP